MHSDPYRLPVDFQSYMCRGGDKSDEEHVTQLTL